MTNKKKQSFIAGALTSSAGIFISKALGLLYIVPFTAMAGETNMVFYSKVYTYYDLLLQICSAGIPFAVAALVAKYANNEDYKTVILIRKISMGLLLTSGVILGSIFALSSKNLSALILGPNSNVADIQTLRNLFMILSVAVFIVPFLSSFRGFYQGLKEMKAYAFSQVIEQLVRVLSLLFLGALVVYVFHFDRIYSVYTAIASITISALFAIGFFVQFDKKNFYIINRAARMQKTSGKLPKEVLQELIIYGLPFFISSILGNSMDFVNTNFFQIAMAKAGYAYDEAKLLEGIIQVQCNKLTSIPQVLAIGFSSGIIPYLTVCLEKKDWKTLQKNILDCLDTVLYIALPLSACLLFLARPIYYIMYGSAHLDYGSEALAYSSLLAITGTISPICTSFMMTLKQRKRSIRYLILGFMIKLISFYPMIRYFGYTGAILSSVLTSVVLIFLNLQCISNKYNISYKRVALRAIKMLACILAMNGAFVILKYLGFDFACTSKSFTFIQLAIYGICGILVYFYCSYLLRLPQKIFNIDLNKIKRMILKK